MLSPANFSRKASGDERHHGLADHAGGRDGADIAAFHTASTVSLSPWSTDGSGFRSVEIGFMRREPPRAGRW